MKSAPFAGRCLICGGEGRDGRELCDGCKQDLPRTSRNKISRKIEGISNTFAAFEYIYPMTDLIKAAKFQRDLCALAILKASFAEAVSGLFPGVDIVVPVPLSFGRFLNRGFNQAAELACALATANSLRVRGDCLQKVLSTSAQTKLTARQRQVNLVHAFWSFSRVKNTVVLVVDDVVTTGATLSAVARALRDAGAKDVRAAVLAVTQ